ncbi:hypothetical protein EDC01DRAFT_776905 [Geopyxis carbonaria]|nr:hypothetical protein EDC01DRAFT_776905 [Geopyxis carbonaria]
MNNIDYNAEVPTTKGNRNFLAATLAATKNFFRASYAAVTAKYGVVPPEPAADATTIYTYRDRYPSRADRLLLFLHIPRSFGSRLRHDLEDIIEWATSFPEAESKEEKGNNFRFYTLKEAERLRLKSHFQFGTMMLEGGYIHECAARTLAQRVKSGRKGEWPLRALEGDMLKLGQKMEEMDRAVLKVLVREGYVSRRGGYSGDGRHVRVRE